MNQRFEDTYDKATNAVCGMAKDYRLIEEKNRHLRHHVKAIERQADVLRDKLSAAQVKIEELQLTNGVLALDLVRASEKDAHPEYHEERFSLSSRTVEHEESDIDLAPEAPILYGNFFDVIAWRWVFNTVGHTISRW